MKKNLLLTFVACMLTGSVYAEDIIVIDSIHSSSSILSGTTRILYTYNAKGQEIESNTYTPDTNGSVYRTAEKTTYDEAGNKSKSEIYSYPNGAETLESYTVYSDFDAKGNPGKEETYSKDNAGSFTMTEETTHSDYQGNLPGKSVTRTLQDGVWGTATMVCEFNSFGAYSSMTTTIEMSSMGMTIKTENKNVFEYNDRQLPIKMTSTSSTNMGGMVIPQGETITTMVYLEYDQFDQPKVMTETVGDMFTETTTYYRSSLKSGPTAIKNLQKKILTQGIFGLNGRRMGTSLEGLPRGIYIVKDQQGTRKVVKE